MIPMTDALERRLLNLENAGRALYRFDRLDAHLVQALTTWAAIRFRDERKRPTFVHDMKAALDWVEPLPGSWWHLVPDDADPFTPWDAKLARQRAEQVAPTAQVIDFGEVLRRAAVRRALERQEQR